MAKSQVSSNFQAIPLRKVHVKDKNMKDCFCEWAQAAMGLEIKV